MHPLTLCVATLSLAVSTKAFVPSASVIAPQPVTCQHPTKPIKIAPPFNSVLKVASTDGTDADLKAIHQDADTVFTIIDVDGDGFITRDELTSHMGKAGYTDEAVEKIFVALDTNKDGVVSKEEFRSGLTKFAQLRSAPGLGDYNSQFVEEIHVDADFLFGIIDIDRSGTISPEELKEHLTTITKSVHMTKYSVSAIANIFRMLDVNDDGEISKEELRDAFVRYSALRQALGEGPNYK